MFSSLICRLSITLVLFVSLVYHDKEAVPLPSEILISYVYARTTPQGAVT